MASGTPRHTHTGALLAGLYLLLRAGRFGHRVFLAWHCFGLGSPGTGELRATFLFFDSWFAKRNYLVPEYNVFVPILANILLDAYIVMFEWHYGKKKDVLVVWGCTAHLKRPPPCYSRAGARFSCTPPTPPNVEGAYVKRRAWV